MRLNPQELAAIRSTLQALDPNGAVFLYGSRVDDSRRGGDIDVYLEASTPLDLKASLRAQYALCSACDAHVDLLVKNPDQPPSVIHQIARAGIRL